MRYSAACAVTRKGAIPGYGTANAQRDARLAESLIELAETRSIARALRFAGYGLEYTGAEEVSHVGNSEPERERTSYKDRESGPSGGNGDGKPETNRIARQWNATTAQVRALYALTKKAQYSPEDLPDCSHRSMPPALKNLTRESASS